MCALDWVCKCSPPTPSLWGLMGIKPFLCKCGMQTTVAVFIAVTFGFPLRWSQVERWTENFQLLLQNFTLVAVFA